MALPGSQGAGSRVMGGDLDAARAWPGELKAWESLEALGPDDVCARAEVTYDRAAGLYGVRCYGADFSVAPGRREILSGDPLGRQLLDTKEYFFSLSILWYLACARDIPLSGRMVNPVHMKGGQMFARGTHVLPLGELALRYGDDREGFLKQGARFGGVPGGHGDVSVRLPAFPRVPVHIALWLGDDEFPARADLLFDATCELQVPTDVVWSIASMTVLLMLSDV